MVDKAPTSPGGLLNALQRAPELASTAGRLDPATRLAAGPFLAGSPGWRDLWTDDGGARAVGGVADQGARRRRTNRTILILTGVLLLLIAVNAVRQSC